RGRTHGCTVREGSGGGKEGPAPAGRIARAVGAQALRGDGHRCAPGVVGAREASPGDPAQLGVVARGIGALQQVEPFLEEALGPVPRYHAGAELDEEQDQQKSRHRQREGEEHRTHPARRAGQTPPRSARRGAWRPSGGVAPVVAYALKHRSPRPGLSPAGRSTTWPRSSTGAPLTRLHSTPRARPTMATAARRPGSPLPSTMVPPRMTR